MNFIKYKLKKIKISKRKILTVSLCLVVFVMSLGYAALSQHMDIDGIAQIDRNWIVKIVSITSSVTNDGVDTSHSFVGTTATLHASLPTTSATVKYEIVLENQGNIPAKLSTIEKTEDTNYSITYEIEGVLEDTTVLKPGETNKAIVTIKAQDGVTNLSNTTKDLMLGFDYVEKSTSLDNNSGNTTDNGYMAYQPGDAVMLDPGDGTERLFYVVSLNNTSASFSSGGDLTVELIADEGYACSAVGSAPTCLGTYVSGWTKITSSRVPTMEEIAKLSGYKMSQIDNHVTTGDNIIPEWLAGSQIGYTATSTRNGDKYYLVKNNGSDGGKVELGANSTGVSVRPIITVGKSNLSKNGYPVYEIGDKVTLVDGSIWYVTGKTGQLDSMITLYSSTILKTGAFDTSGSTKYNPLSSTNVGYYIQNTYLPSIKTKLSTAGGNVTGISARLLSADEALDLYKVDNSLFQDTANAAPTWILPSDNGSLTFSQGIPGLLAVPSTTSGVNVRGVVTTLKSNIKSVDLGYRITNVNNIAKADTDIDFSQPTQSTNSGLYRERQYYNNSISFNSSTTYYFGKSYTFDSTTGLYSLVTTTSSTWANMSSNYSTYSYTCKSTSSTGTCYTLYKLTGYTNATEGAGYTFTFVPIERIYTETTSSTTTYSYTSTYLYGTSYKFDIKNGVYELVNPASITSSDLPSKYSTYKYTCRSNNTSRCLSMYEIQGVPVSGEGYYTKSHSYSSSNTSNVSSNGNGLYYTSTNTENDLPTYYFRGNVVNNYVRFANRVWRIIRVNEDGSIRLITQDAASEVLSKKFNSSSDDNAYVGYMYGTPGSTTYAATHANTNSSAMKDSLDYFYGLIIRNYSGYIADAGFCGDRSLTSGTGIGTTTTYYAARSRLLTNFNPQFKCPQINDFYTLKSSTKGNKTLTNAIGLITADEAVFAGLVDQNSDFSKGNSYLKDGGDSWTMTPNSFFSPDTSTIAAHTRVFAFGPGSPVYWNYTDSTANIRPVINIKPNVKTISGSGTSSNPYTFS